MTTPYLSMSDEKLMMHYQNEEHLAFNEIYNRYSRKVYSYLNKRLKSKEEIDDIFQSIFVKFHKQRANYNNKFSLSQWIFTICRSELLDHIKSPKKVLLELDENLISSVNSENTDGIALDLSELSQNEQVAIKLRYYHDQDYDEISDVLNSSQSNARKLVSRGINKLRKKLGAR